MYQHPFRVPKLLEAECFAELVNAIQVQVRSESGHWHDHGADIIHTSLLASHGSPVYRRCEQSAVNAVKPRLIFPRRCQLIAIGRVDKLYPMT